MNLAENRFQSKYSNDRKNKCALYARLVDSASFLDLHLSISDGFVKTKIYDKRDDFDFDIVNFDL